MLEAPTNSQSTSSPNRESDDLTDIVDTGPIDGDPYPPGTSPLTHIIFSGLLGEYSNAPPIHQGIPLVGRPRFMPRSVFASLPPRIQPCLFALYQTGMHGPQNGWKLVCVEAGNDPVAVGIYLEGLGRIEKDSKGMIIFQPPRPAANADADIDTAETDIDVLLHEDNPDDYTRVISHLLHSTSIPTIALSTHLGQPDRTLDSHPTHSSEIPTVRSFEAVLASDRSALFVISDDRAEDEVPSGSTNPDQQPKRYLVLVKEGHNAGVVGKKCIELVDGGVGAGSFIIFGSVKRQEGIRVYDQQGILKHID